MPVAAVLAIAAGPSFAQAADPSATAPLKLNPVVITETRIEQSRFLLPMSADVVEAAVIRDGRPLVNVSKALSRVPGLVIQNHQNYAQNLQISSRGFGARAPFGIRDIQVIVDDIPVNNPDGQGQAGQYQSGFGITRCACLRGPFSAIYGNASGGVIQAFTEDGPAATVLSGMLRGGSYGTSRGEIKLGGTLGGTAGASSADGADANGTDAI